jgi:hypothetical protein
LPKSRIPGGSPLSIITAYHLHEWVWGDWLKTDYAAWKQLGIKDKDSFVAWIERECPAFTTVQDLANGAKHFIRKQEVETRRVAGYGMGPYPSRNNFS